MPIPSARRDGRLNLGIRRLEASGRRQMRMQARPEFCTRCDGTRLLRMLWRYFDLAGEDTEAVSAGQAFLGLDHRYFTSANPTLVVGEFFAKQSSLPEWVCLDCSPQWADVHRYASAEWQIAVAKNAAGASACSRSGGSPQSAGARKTRWSASSATSKVPSPGAS